MHTIDSSLSEAQIQMNLLGKLRIPFFFLLDFELKKPRVVALDKIDARELLFDFRGVGNAQHLPVEALPKNIFFQKYPMPLETYQPKFEYVQQQINQGNSFLLNLTGETPISCNLSLQNIFFHSRALYRLWLRDTMVCYSPETFVQIQDQQIATFPMKGTINAALPDAEKQILADPKELAEHYTIVDFLRNDLSRVAKKVQVARFRYLDRVRTSDKELLQVSSKITGILPSDYHQSLGDLIFSMLPAGSICGAPKPKALEIIQKAEGYERGYYTGVAGIFDGKNLDSAVLIRYIEQKNDGQLVYKSGGGITSFSVLEKEYQELIDKVYIPKLNYYEAI